MEPHQVLIIVVVAIIASTVVRLARIRAGTDHLPRGRRARNVPQAFLDTAQPSPREIELQKEVAELKDRIHVLERIATDGRRSRDLADEIENLRGH